MLELSAHLHVVGDTLTAHAQAGIGIAPAECGTLGAQLIALSKCFRLPALTPPGTEPISPAGLRRAAIRLNAQATLVGMGNAPQPEALRMAACEMFAAADALDELRARDAARNARLRAVG